MGNQLLRRGVRRVWIAEQLEARRILATVSWDGGAGTLDWGDAANWSNDVVPNALDDVSIDVGPTASVLILSGTRSVKSLDSRSGVSVFGGTLSVAEASTIAGKFQLLGTGSLGGAGSVHLNGGGTWLGGSMSGLGTTFVGSGTTLTLSGTTNLMLSRDLSNEGTIQWSGSSDLFLTDAILTNAGLIRHSNASEVAAYIGVGGRSAILNTGQIIKDGGGTVTLLTTLTNSGSLEINVGLMKIGSVVQNHGTFQTRDPATTIFDASLNSFSDALVGGDGMYHFRSGTHVLNAPAFQATGLVRIQGTATVTANVPMMNIDPFISGVVAFHQPVHLGGAAGFSGTIDFHSTLDTTFSSFSIGSAVVTLHHPSDLSVGTFSIAGGTLETQGDIEVTQSISLGDGSILGSGTFRLATAVSTSPSFVSLKLAKDFFNAGTITTSSVTRTLSLNDATFHNAGTIQVSSGTFTVNTMGGDSRVENAGSLSGSAAVYSVPVTNTGIISLRSATFSASSVALDNRGSVFVDGGSSLKIGTTVMNPGSTISGTGTVDFITGGNNTLEPDTFTHTGRWTFSGGTVVVNLPRTFADAQGIGGSVTFNQPIAFLSTATFSGSVTVNASASFQANATIGGTATFNAHAVFASTVSFNGTGTLNQSVMFGGKVTVGSRLNVNTADPAGVVIDQLFFTGGTLGGSGLVTVTGSATHNSSMTMDGAGTTIITAAAYLNVGGSLTLNRTLINNGQVNFPSEPQDIYFNNGTFINNGLFSAAGNGTIDRLQNVSGTNRFENNGTFRVASTGQSHTVAVEVHFDNNGLVVVTGGRLRFEGTTDVGQGSPMTAGRYETSTNTLLWFVQPVTTLAAEMKISGTLTGLSTLALNRGNFILENGADLTVTPATGTLVNEGLFAVSANSLLTIHGNLSTGGTGEATIEAALAGAASFGKVVVDGSLWLDSAETTRVFRVKRVGTYEPAAGIQLALVVAAGGIGGALDRFDPDATMSGNPLTLLRPDANTFAVGVGANDLLVPPRVISEHVEWQTQQAIVLEFDQDVAYFTSRKDFQLRNVTSGQVVPVSVGSVSFDVAAKTATFVFTNQLSDGQYRIEFDPQSVENAAGVPGTGAPVSIEFPVLRGDSDRNGVVDFSDLLTLAQNYGTTDASYSMGDFNYDGTVNFDDLLMLTQNYGVSMRSPPVKAKTNERLQTRVSIDG